VLERLGAPEEIAAAAGPAAAPRPERGRHERVALLVLALSFIVPGVGYLIGAGLVLASSVWDGRDKLVALLIPPLVLIGGGVVVALAVASGASAGGGLGPVEIVVVIAIVFSGVIAAAYLSRRPQP
jgi:hypothetical protein